MNENYGAEYEQKDNSPEVEETRQASLNYILDGASQNQVFDLKGIIVFAVISMLRENDETLHGDTSTLDIEQQARLAEVEEVVDTAIYYDLQYYPWGDKLQKRSLDPKVLAQLSVGAREFIVPRTSGGRNNVKQKRRLATRKVVDEKQEKINKNSPVTIRHKEDI